MSNLRLPETTSLGIGAKMSKNLRRAKRYVIFRYRSIKNPNIFRDLKTYCMFIGHARSGHSIIGALIDAHPNAVLADEVDVLRCIEAGSTRDEIYHLILTKSMAQARKERTKNGRDGMKYSYLVPGQWQGSFAKLQVIGDSKAGRSTQRLAQDPALSERLQNMMAGVDIKFIHIIRNPYDTISTMNLRSGRALEDGIERYFSNCDTIMDLERRIQGHNLFSIKHEEFIAQPKVSLASICAFLGIEATEEYLTSCASILYQNPAKSRNKVQWSPELLDIVRRKIDKFDFLAGYSYED